MSDRPDPEAPDPERPGEGRPWPESPPPRPHGEEVRAEPYDARSERGSARTVDMPPPGEEPAEKSRIWPIACHLSGLLDLALAPLLLGVLAPMVIWLAVKDTDPEVEHHGKEAFNFQLNLLMWTVIGAVLSCCLVGIPILVALPVVEIVLAIVAAVAAANGERYRYPFIVRFLP